MADNKLTQILEQLHRELENTEALDEKGRELLGALNVDIQNLLKRSGNESSDDSLLERLQDTMDHFEATHPALTSTLSNIMNILINAGI